MINYLIHDVDGNLIRKGQCLDVDYHLQAQEGEYISKGDALIEPQLDSPEFTLRGMRNKLLKDTDWTQMPDSPLTDAQKEQYRKYRKALRDLPSKYGTINNIDEVIYPRLEDFNEE